MRNKFQFDSVRDLLFFTSPITVYYKSNYSSQLAYCDVFCEGEKVLYLRYDMLNKPFHIGEEAVLEMEIGHRISLLYSERIRSTSKESFLHTVNNMNYNNPYFQIYEKGIALLLEEKTFHVQKEE